MLKIKAGHNKSHSKARALSLQLIATIALGSADSFGASERAMDGRHNPAG
ncbi:hypothetical protein [Mariprofundus erugo]|nr:hypothetical protein [Mariprofundus erugo]